jgi:hypothetical protein
MATVTTGYTFVNNETVTPTKLNSLAGGASVSNIVDADVSASAGIADTKLATIATAGKVSNSATTATSANTANAIVARDASGNFTAGTVTANTSGTHTGPVIGNVTGNLTGTASALAAGVKFPNFSSGSSRAYNTVFQAATDGFLCVSVAGSFINGIQVVIGSTSSPTIQIWQSGDDINVNTKYASSGLLPIPAGTYYQAIPIPGIAAFETITITWFPVN